MSLKRHRFEVSLGMQGQVQLQTNISITATPRWHPAGVPRYKTPSHPKYGAPEERYKNPF